MKSFRHHQKLVEVGDGFKSTLVVQPHENKVYIQNETLGAEKILEHNVKTRNEFSGQGKGMDFILSIPPYDHQKALLEYNLQTGSMEDRRREAERMARDHPEWVAYTKNPRRFARRQ